MDWLCSIWLMGFRCQTNSYHSRNVNTIYGEQPDDFLGEVSMMVGRWWVRAEHSTFGVPCPKYVWVVIVSQALPGFAPAPDNYGFSTVGGMVGPVC